MHGSYQIEKINGIYEVSSSEKKSSYTYDKIKKQFELFEEIKMLIMIGSIL
ncbi:hypothetical protein JCM18903_2217 [Psychrobacter sp. JCM 18903]|nr:hypothetical protein JCM18903_2217 [Psychrobacter sp. JCM 18903]